MELAETSIASIAELVAARIQERQKTIPAITFGELFDRFMELHVNLRLKDPTDIQRRYRVHLNHLANRKVDEIARSEVLQLHAEIASKSGHYAANRALQLLRSIYNRGVEFGVIDCPNPAQRFKKLKEIPRDRFLEKDEVSKLLAAIKGLRYETSRDLLLMLLFTGQRRANVMQMEWSEISFARAVWHIPAEKMKNGLAFNLPLCVPALEILEKRRFSESRHQRWVFPAHRTGSNQSTTDVWRAWKSCLREAGLSNVRIHDLRRTLASWQVITGADIRVVAATLNHSDLNSTMIYARLNTDAMRSAITTAVTEMSNGVNLNSVSGYGDIGKFEKCLRTHLTDEFIENAQGPVKALEVRYYDDEIRTLMLHVRKSGLKSFVVAGKLRGKWVSHTIGYFPSVCAKDARELAQQVLARIASGIHPGGVSKSQMQKSQIFIQRSAALALKR